MNVSGRLWLDAFPGWGFYRDNGLAWEKWGRFNEFTEPDPLLFTWVNQGAASYDSTYGPTVLQTPAPGLAGDDVHMRVQALQPQPDSLIIGFVPNLDPFNNTSCGLVLRESSTGKFIFSRLLFDTTSAITKSDVVFSVDKYNSPTSFNSNYTIASAGFLRGSVIWLSVFYDTTNIIWSYSNDGANYTTLTTQSLTDFLASGPNQIGFAINSNTTSAGAGMTLLSWD